MPGDRKPLTPEQYKSDLREAVAEVDRIRARGIEELAAHPEWTPERIKIWEASFSMVRGILADVLYPLELAWSKDLAQYRATEEMEGK